MQGQPGVGQGAPAQSRNPPPRGPQSLDTRPVAPPQALTLSTGSMRKSLKRYHCWCVTPWGERHRHGLRAPPQANAMTPIPSYQGKRGVTMPCGNSRPSWDTVGKSLLAWVVTMRT